MKTLNSAFGLSVLLILNGCNSDNFPTNGYPGPSGEAPTTFALNDESYACSLPDATKATEMCVTNPTTFTTNKCGYSQIKDYCKAAWDANTKSIGGNIHGCEFQFLTADRVFYFGEEDLADLNLSTFCTTPTGTAAVHHTDRFSTGADQGSDVYIVGYPYQGQYDNMLRTIRISISNWTEDPLTSEFKNSLTQYADQIPQNFGSEVWNFMNPQGILTSFPTKDNVQISFEEKGERGYGWFVNYCPDKKVDDNCTSTNFGDHIKSEGSFNRGTGVSNSYIDINVAIVDEKSAWVDDQSNIQYIPQTELGEITTTPGSNGLFIWYYALGSAPSLTVVMHEIGHALLNHHSLINAADAEPHDGLMVPEYPGSRVHPDYPNIDPYYGSGLSVNGIRSGIALYEDRMLIWPTAEGYSVGSGANMNLSNDTTNKEGR